MRLEKGGGRRKGKVSNGNSSECEGWKGQLILDLFFPNPPIPLVSCCYKYCSLILFQQKYAASLEKEVKSKQEEGQGEMAAGCYGYGRIGQDTSDENIFFPIPPIPVISSCSCPSLLLSCPDPCHCDLVRSRSLLIFGFFSSSYGLINVSILRSTQFSLCCWVKL